jgi:hypothetical protein
MITNNEFGIKYEVNSGVPSLDMHVIRGLARAAHYLELYEENFRAGAAETIRHSSLQDFVGLDVQTLDMLPTAQRINPADDFVYKRAYE